MGIRLSDGRIASTDEAIIALFTYHVAERRWENLGTGFFVNPVGGFVTARHVVMKMRELNVDTLYGVHTTPDMERHIRVAQHFVLHPNEEYDIAMGMLSYRREHGQNLEPVNSIICQMNFDELQVGNEVKTYTYPSATMEELEGTAVEFTLGGVWNEGVVDSYREEGAGRVRNPCYITTLAVEGGSSGGPVFKNGRVVGINSSGISGVYSTITPISLLLDMQVPSGETTIPVVDLLQSGHLLADGYPK